MKWKEIAFNLYFKTHGRRCVICSKTAVPKEAHLELRDAGLYLMHKQCKKGLR